MHLVAILKHSPGPICNAVRSLVHTGQPLAKITLLQNASSKALREPLVKQIELDAPDVTVVFHEIPSLDDSHEDMIKCFKELNLDATHILTDAAAALLLCSLLCHLPEDIILVNSRWNREGNSLDLIVGGNSPSKISEIGADESITLHGLTKTNEGNYTLSYWDFKSRKDAEQEIPIVSFTSSGESSETFQASRIEVDSRGCLIVIFDVCDDFHNRPVRGAWEAFVFGQAGKWNQLLGDHAVIFRACSVNKTGSLWGRLKSLNWEVKE